MDRNDSATAHSARSSVSAGIPLPVHGGDAFR
ncbi:hypothetical protein JOE58_002122 [Curtobacterium luteum]|uniref:Uncharacterized protein n=1 Tax=Curtobacterium luteum TaxID=33881 RepID=A0ABS2RV82_9MICO|nr:hypothetical protein [Curtobacterium luteum]